MTKARAKGTRWETKVVEWLRGAGFLANRLPLSSPKGDIEIRGIPVAIECKDHRRLDLSAWCKQAESSMRAQDAIGYVVIHHRPGFGAPSDAYATMPAWFLADLLERVQWPGL